MNCLMTYLIWSNQRSYDVYRITLSNTPHTLFVTFLLPLNRLDVVSRADLLLSFNIERDDFATMILLFCSFATDWSVEGIVIISTYADLLYELPFGCHML